MKFCYKGRCGALSGCIDLGLNRCRVDGVVRRGQCTSASASATSRDVEICRFLMRDVSLLHCSHGAMHLRSLDEFKRQCMRGKIAVMRKDWLLAYGVNVQGKIEKSRESNTRNLVGLRIFYNTTIWYGMGCRVTVTCGGRARGATAWLRV